MGVADDLKIVAYLNFIAKLSLSNAHSADQYSMLAISLFTTLFFSHFSTLRVEGGRREEAV